MDAFDTLNNRRILVVEDEFFLASDLEKRLSSAGAIVVGPAPTVQRASTLIDGAEQLDAALLDVNLRDVLVYPVAHELQQRHVPFLFTTGYDQLVVPAEYRDVPRVNKPYEMAEVLERLRGLLS